MRDSWDEPRPCSLMASIGATPAARNAGAVPNSSAVRMVTALVNASTRQSSARSRKTVLVWVDNCRTRSWLPQRATSRPSDAPTVESRRLSMSSRRTSRHREAPSASRTLHSCRRAADAGEQQVRDVGARDQQHQRDHDHDGDQRLPIAVTQLRAAAGGRHHRERLFQVVLLIRRAPVGRQRRFAKLRLVGTHRRRGRVNRLAGFQPRHDGKPPPRPLVERRFLAAKQRLGADRDGDVEGATDVGAEEVRSGDADDRERDFVETQPLSDGVADPSAPNRRCQKL